jgi:hypothetical protein
MSPAKTSINLTKSAELVLERNQHISNRSARISQVLVRYGMLLRAHRTEELLKLAHNQWVLYCVSEWAEAYPVPATSLNMLLQLVWDEMEETGQVPPAEELRELLEATANLTAIEQMVIIEEIESRI